ncbi:hypothetical protein GYA49_00480 [Candidatus Beckwithbacteria bacterium]|nr:hypothetical protein [Candidatus Beckwithbacteria bacterium]
MNKETEKLAIRYTYKPISTVISLDRDERYKILGNTIRYLNTESDSIKPTVDELDDALTIIEFGLGHKLGLRQLSTSDKTMMLELGRIETEHLQQVHGIDLNFLAARLYSELSNMQIAVIEI